MDSGQKIVDENLAKNAAAAGSSRRKSFWSTFRNFSKRKQIGLVLVILLLLSGLVLLSRNVFFADILGVNFSGKIYGQDTKLPLAGVNVSVQSNNEDASPVTATTDANGFYSLTLPDSSYNQVVISKDGYWDMAGNIINASGISRIEANLALKPGFGQEQIQLTTIKKERIGRKTHFGLSLQPFDDSPASLKQIVPEGNSYKEKSAYSRLRGYDLEKNDFISSSDTPGQAVSLGNITNDLAHSSAAYSPDTDRYYLFANRKVYEFDRNAPNELSEINQSYDDFSGGASIYLPEYRLILIISGGHAWFFRPQNNQLITLDDMEVPEYDRQKFIRAKGNLFLLGELNAAPGKTGISSIALNEMLFAYTPDTCFQEGKNCRLVVKRDLNVVNKTGLMPYYYPKEDKIYFLGGINGEDGKVSDKILVFDPNNPSQTATKLDQSHKLPKPLAGAAYYSTDNNFYLFGGVTDENGSLNKETITFRSRDHYANAESYRPTFAENISNYPFTQDNSSRTIVFTPNVLSITGSLTLKAGQAYYVEQSSSDYTLVFRGKAKRDNFSFVTKEIQENNWQNYKHVWFANPFMNTITFNEVTIRYQDQDYSLKEAAGAGIINNNVSVSGYNNTSWSSQKNLDLDNLTDKFMPGDYVVFGSKKSGVKVYIGKENVQVKAIDGSTGESLSDVDVYPVDLTLDLSNSNYIAEKPGYNQKFINIVNPSHVIDVGFNLDFNPGGETEYLQAFPMQKDKKVEFGLSLEPKDANAVKILTKQGDSYIEQPLADDIYFFDYEKQDFVKKAADAPLFSGYVYSIQPSSNYTLLIDGGNSTGESASFVFNSTNKSYKITPSFLDNRFLSDYQIDYQGEYYNLVKASQASLIEPQITIGLKTIDLSKLSTKDLDNYQVKTGEVFSFEPQQSLTLNEERIIEYDYRAYTAIPQMVKEMQNESIPDEEIVSILDQLDQCDPPYFELNTTPEERDQCLNNLQLTDDIVSSNGKKSNVAWLPVAKAATKQRKKEIIKKYSSDWQVRTEQFIERVKFMRKTYGKQKEGLATWDWPKFLQTTNSETNRYKFMYDDPKSESYWKQIPKNPIFRKKYWSDKDLNVLYIWYWPDLANNRYSNDFTPEERKRIQQMWKMGLDKAAANLSNLPNPGDIGITGPSPWDDVFMLMPFSKYFVMGGETCVVTLGKKLCSSSVNPTFEGVVSEGFTKVKAKAGGVLLKTKSVIVKDKITVSTPDLKYEFNKWAKGGDQVIYELSKSAKGSGLLSRKKTIKGLELAAKTTEKLTKSKLFPILTDTLGSENHAKYYLYNDARKFEILTARGAKATGQYDFYQRTYGFNSMVPTINEHTLYLSEEKVTDTIIHEMLHSRTMSKRGKLLIEIINPGGKAASILKNPIDEGLMAYTTDYVISDYPFNLLVGGSYIDERNYLITTMAQALERAHGWSYHEAQYAVVSTYLKYGDEKAVNYLFNDLARQTIDPVTHKPLIGINENFYDALSNKIMMANGRDLSTYKEVLMNTRNSLISKIK